MKIANKISLSFFIISIILTTVAVSIFYMTSKSSLEETIYAHLKTAAYSRAHHINTFLEAQKDALVQLSQSVVFENLLKTGRAGPDYKDRFDATMLRLQKTEEANKAVYEILVLDAKGKIVASDNRERIGLDKSGDAYFLRGKEGPYIKDAYYSETTKREALAISAPIIDNKSRELLGIAVAKISLDILNKITTDRTGLGETGEIYLVNKDGYMLTPSRFIPGTFLKLKVDTGNIRKAFEHIKKFGAEPHPEESFIYTGYRGVRVLGMHQHIPQMQWYLLAETDEKEVFAPLAKIRRLAAMLMFFIPIIAWLIGISFSKIISRPIYSLHRGTEIVGAGDLDYKIDIGTRDEIGQLSRAFDKMTDDLKKTTTSIANLNKEIAGRKQVEKELQEAYTGLKSAQSQLVQAAKMEVVGRLASGVAHEVKNPLAIILQGIEYLSEEKQLRDKNILSVLKDMTDALRRADSVIKGLLDFSSLSEVNMVAENLNSVLETSLLLMKHQFDKYHIQVTRDLKKDIPAVKIDKNRIEQVFINLLSNAVYAMPNGGKLMVKTYTKKFEGEIVIIAEIEDTGEEIPKDILDKIFDPFFTTRRAAEGTGLGLTVARNIVQMHNGRIEINNKEGGGVRATVIFET